MMKEDKEAKPRMTRSCVLMHQSHEACEDLTLNIKLES